MDEELYFIDTRNADPRDHRVVRPGTIVPARPVAVAPVTTPRFTYAAPTTYATAPAMAFPPSYAQASFFGAPPVYAQPPWMTNPWMGQLGQLFGGLNLGDVVKLAADGFAAFKSLPAAPVPTGDPATDIANVDVHLTALAKDAQTRKQIEFAGTIAGRFGRGYGAW
jgi:hypothetical protein